MVLALAHRISLAARVMTLTVAVGDHVIEQGCCSRN
jgi:hypothetical protein